MLKKLLLFLLIFIWFFWIASADYNPIIKQNFLNNIEWDDLTTFIIHNSGAYWYGANSICEFNWVHVYYCISMNLAWLNEIKQYTKIPDLYSNILPLSWNSFSIFGLNQTVNNLNNIAWLTSLPWQPITITKEILSQYLECNNWDVLIIWSNNRATCTTPPPVNTQYISWNGSWITIEQKSIDTMSDNVSYLTFSTFELMKFMPYIATLTIAFFILAYILAFAKIKPKK